jgi:hypothetical protein
MALLAGACHGSGDAGSGAEQSAADRAGVVNANAPLAGPAAAARADLARKLGVDESAIEVVSVREVTWRDGSVGCPQPGMQYPQVLVNGSQIVLRHAGDEYHYHSGRGREPFYCASPQPPLDADAGGFGET